MTKQAMKDFRLRTVFHDSKITKKLSGSVNIKTIYLFPDTDNGLSSFKVSEGHNEGGTAQDRDTNFKPSIMEHHYLL
jgi:hypothetical protein